MVGGAHSDGCGKLWWAFTWTCACGYIQRKLEEASLLLLWL